MFRKTLAFMTAFAAAACMFVSCGDKNNDTGESLTKCETLSGKYQVCDIDGFSGNDSCLEFRTDGSFTMTHSSDDNCVRYTGSYKLSGDDITLSYRKFTKPGELKEAYSVFSDADEKQLTGFIEAANRSVDDEAEKYRISGETVCTEDGHGERKKLYSHIAEQICVFSLGSGLKGKDGRYSFCSSDSSISDISIPDGYQEEISRDINNINRFDKYTQEEGFTDGFDLSRHEWLVAVSGKNIVAFGIGKDFDSNVCSIIITDGADGDEKPETLRELYEFYTRRNK